MNIAIFGLGYVGLVAAGCLTKQGHHVVGVDVSEAKVQQLNDGVSPIHEPGLDELLDAARAADRLAFRTTIGDCLADRDLAIVCVGTPSAPDGSHDMSHIVDVSRQIAEAIDPARRERLTVAYRSTIRPGSIEGLIAPIFQSVLGARADIVELVYNPEFLRESVAVRDFFAPPKIVVGTRDGRPSATMTALHEGLHAKTFHTGFKEAEFTKFVDNTFHALKVSFANEIGRISQTMGIRAHVVHEIFVSDTKLNISPYYMRPGGAFGGSCLPKDVRALCYMADDIGANTQLIHALIPSNEAHKQYLFEHCTRNLAPGARVLLLGLAFKSNSDDLRESPNVDLARQLIDAGYALRVFDRNLDPSALIGQNLAHVRSRLPELSSLLIREADVDPGRFDRIIDSTGSRQGLSLGDVELFDIHTLH